MKYNVGDIIKFRDENSDEIKLGTVTDTGTPILYHIRVLEVMYHIPSKNAEYMFYDSIKVTSVIDIVRPIASLDELDEI